MQRIFFWFGGLLCILGAALVTASGVMIYMGLGASYNLGDPTKFQFVLVPFWQIGLGIAAVGVVLLAAARWLKRAPS